MISIIDPTPTGNNPSAMLIFSESSMTSTRLYTRGTDATSDPLYVVSCTANARRVTIRRGPRKAGAVVAEVHYPSDLQRLMGKSGTVQFAGAFGREIALHNWLTNAKKGDGEYARQNVNFFGGEGYAWAERLTNLAATTKVYAVSRMAWCQPFISDIPSVDESRRRHGDIRPNEDQCTTWISR